MARGEHAFFRLWRYWDRSCLDARHIVERLCDNARALGWAVMVAVAVSAPLECKGGGTHGRVMVFVATVNAVIKDFKGAPKAWSRYWPSPAAFRCGSSDNNSRSLQYHGILPEHIYLGFHTFLHVSSSSGDSTILRCTIMSIPCINIIRTQFLSYKTTLFLVGSETLLLRRAGPTKPCVVYSVQSSRIINYIPYA